MASLAPGRPPSKAASGRAACCCWMESWLPGRLFPPAVQARPAGEEAPGLRSVSRTPCHNKGTMAWMGWRWEGGRAAHLCSHSHQGRGQVAGRSAPSSPPRPVLFSTLSGTVSHRGAKENRGLRKRFWAVAGVPQLWEVAELGEGTGITQAPLCLGLSLMGYRSVSPTSTQKTLSPCILVSSGPAQGLPQSRQQK